MGAVGSATANVDGTLGLDGNLILVGTIASPAGLVVGAGGGTLQLGGDPNADDGVGAANLDLADGADIFGKMEVSSVGTLTSEGQLFDGGTLKLDDGSTTSLSSYQQSSSGTLEEEAASDGTSSSLTVSGSAQLSGILTMDFLDGYTPPSGTVFPVLTAGSIGAHFDTTPPNMTVNYGSDAVTLTQN